MNLFAANQLTRPSIQFFLNVVLPLVLGVGIYVLFRNNSGLYLETFLPIHVAGLDLPAPDWIKYSLPDGLWLFSGLRAISLIWLKEEHRLGILYHLFLILVSIGSEIFQYHGLLMGTGDICDVMAYIIATAMVYLFP